MKTTIATPPPRPDLDSTLTAEMRRASEAAAWGGEAPSARGAADAAAPAAELPQAEQPAAPAAQSAPGKLPDLSKLD